MKKIFKNIFFFFAALALIDFSKVVILKSKSFASDRNRIDFNFGDSFIIEQNINNLKNRKTLYEESIIEKVRQGKSLDYNWGRYISVKDYFTEEYCQRIGEYTIIGYVAYPTWCNRDNGPFSIVRNSESAILIPLTIELKKGFKSNLIETLSEALLATKLGVIKGHNYSLADMAGSNFKYNQDQLLGLVNEGKSRMMIYKITDLGISRSSNNSKKYSSSSFDLAIDLMNKKNEVYGGVSFAQNNKNCKHHKKCLIDSIHLLEFRPTIYAPKLIFHQKWGYITSKSFPLHSLLEDYGSLKKIFLSRNYYLLIDISPSQRINLSGVEIRPIINE